MKKELATAIKYTYLYDGGERKALLNKSKVYLMIIDDRQIIDEDGDRYNSGRNIGKTTTWYCSSDCQGYVNVYKNIVRESEC